METHLLLYPGIKSSKTNLVWSLQFQFDSYTNASQQQLNNRITRPNSIIIQSSVACTWETIFLFVLGIVELILQFSCTNVHHNIIYAASRSEDRCRNHFNLVSITWCLGSSYTNFGLQLPQVSMSIKSYLY